MTIISYAKGMVKKPLYALDRALYANGVRSVANLTFPHFLGLGPGQCGTSWLFTHLAKHPQVFLPPRKEVHYFDRSFHDWRLSDYSQLFAEGRDRIRGEITPGYSILKQDRIAFIRKIMPDVRLILIVRDPVERSWSAAKRLLQKLGTDIETLGPENFTEYLHMEWQYKTPTGLTLSGDYEPGLLEGQYCRTIEKWLDVFSAEQMLVLYFDELRNDPVSFLSKVCTHIGVDPDTKWPIDALRQKINRNEGPDLSERYRAVLEDIYRDEFEELKTRFGHLAK